MSKWTKEKMNEVYNLAMSKARVDEAFRKSLLEDPNKAIEELSGIAIEGDAKIRVIENDPSYLATFVLPEMIGEEVTADDLDAVAGGSCAANICGADVCVGNVSK